MGAYNILVKNKKSKKNSLKKNRIESCIVIICIVWFLYLCFQNNSAIAKVVYRTGIGETYLEDDKIPAFCQFVEELEASPMLQENPEKPLLCGYYDYEIEYKNGKTKSIVVNATRLAIDGTAHESSQDICDRFRHFFEDVLPLNEVI